MSRITSFSYSVRLSKLRTDWLCWPILAPYILLNVPNDMSYDSPFLWLTWCLLNLCCLDIYAISYCLLLPPLLRSGKTCLLYIMGGDGPCWALNWLLFSMDSWVCNFSRIFNENPNLVVYPGDCYTPNLPAAIGGATDLRYSDLYKLMKGLLFWW